MGKQCVVTFHSTHYALKSERVLKKAKYNIKLVPVPRQFSSNCGLALQFECDRTDEFMDLFKKNRVEIEALHKME
ncbi:MAG: DUF3343 domain-containing protein [Planctomycetota bacterium]